MSWWMLLSTEELKHLSYLDAVIRETLPLNPPIPSSMTRMVSVREGSLHVYGYEVPAGWVASASPYTVGRSGQVFGREEMWLPERWLGEIGGDGAVREKDKTHMRDVKRHFFAFGAGPRMC